MITSMFLSAAALLAPPATAQSEVTVEFSAPAVFVAGSPYLVEVVYTGGDQDAELEAWRFGPAALSVDGIPQGSRGASVWVPFPKGSRITLSLDLSGLLPTSGSFELSFAGFDQETEAKTVVKAYSQAPQGLYFTDMRAEQLREYVVLLRTNRGDMVVEFYPDKAPNHVRNFLDLSYTGFYDGILFHRVGKGFMIQGGCPNTKTNQRGKWGTGSGPRMLDAEFNDVKHVRGILSMARGPSPNSASSQFFVMHGTNPGLDNEYSVFGKLVSGYETLDAIAEVPGTTLPDGNTIRPAEEQKILQAIVLVGSGE